MCLSLLLQARDRMGTGNSIKGHRDQLSSSLHAEHPWVGEGTSLSISVLLHVLGLLLLALQTSQGSREAQADPIGSGNCMTAMKAKWGPNLGLHADK